MPVKTINVIATIKAVPGKEKLLKEILHKPIEPTRREPGCISYILLNNMEDLCEFTFFEEWRSDDDLKSHMESPHFIEVINSLEGLISEEPEIKKYHTVG